MTSGIPWTFKFFLTILGISVSYNCALVDSGFFIATFLSYFDAYISNFLSISLSSPSPSVHFFIVFFRLPRLNAYIEFIFHFSFTFSQLQGSFHSCLSAPIFYFLFHFLSPIIILFHFTLHFFFSVTSYNITAYFSVSFYSFSHSYRLELFYLFRTFFQCFSRHIISTFCSLQVPRLFQTFSALFLFYFLFPSVCLRSLQNPRLHNLHLVAKPILFPK